MKEQRSEQSKDFEESVRDDSETCISDKTKRIKKTRDQAKQRTKAKLDAKSILGNIDPKYIPEGFDNPNLDEATRKKMIQMVRNRVSAQQSRDKKKMHLQELETQIQRLSHDKQLLVQRNNEINNKLKALEISYAQLAHENQELKKIAGACPNCGHSQVMSPSVDYPSTDDRESIPSSPRFSRGSSPYRGGFFNFAMTFATILSVVLMVFLGNGIGGTFDRKK